MTDKARSYQDYFNKAIHYVIIDDLPDDQREAFKEWLFGQTQPIIEAEGPKTDCAYAWDYDLWYDYWIRGEEAPKDQGGPEEMAQELPLEGDGNIPTPDTGSMHQEPRGA